MHGLGSSPPQAHQAQVAARARLQAARVWWHEHASCSAGELQRRLGHCLWGGGGGRGGGGGGEADSVVGLVPLQSGVCFPKCVLRRRVGH